MSNNTSRMRTIFRSKTSKALDKVEDPRETLDDSYDQQVKLLQRVRQAVAAGREVDRRLPAVERLPEPHAQGEDLALRTRTESGASSQHRAGEIAIAADALDQRSQDEDDRGDRNEDDDQEAEEHPEEDVHDYHVHVPKAGCCLAPRAASTTSETPPMRSRSLLAVSRLT